MALLPIDTLIRGVTPEEALEVLVSGLEAVGVPARKWRPGGTMKAFVGVVATAGSIGSNIIAEGIKANFVPSPETGKGASGPWLTLLAKLVYGIDRKPSTFAAGQVTIINQGNQVFTWGADEVILYSSETKARYRVSTPALGTLEFPALAAGGTLTVDVVAIEQGSTSSVAPGQVDSFETVISPKLVVGNEEAIVGIDEETDAELATRCLMRLAMRSSNGPRGAYEFACLSALLPGGTPTSINRCVILPELGDGTVRCVVATPSGAPTTLELRAVRDLIEDAARTDTDTVALSAAVEVPYSKTVTVWRRGGSDEAVRANAERALPAFFSTYPIGGIKKSAGQPGYLYADALESAIISSSPGVVFDVDQDGGDIELAFNEVPVVATTLLIRSAA